MAVPRHNSYREDRMVWAFDRVHGCLVRIGLGQATGLRDRARSGELVCPVGDCASPALTTRRSYLTGSGTLVPDGFRHLHAPNPAHEPESQLHITGKLVVARWLGRTGWNDVRLERRDTQAGRTPDVSAIKAGRRIAVEVQYAQLTVDEWSKRTNALIDSGFDVLWLWGVRQHRAPQSAMTRTTAVHAEMLRRGLPLVWFDPDADAFGVSAGVRNLKPRGRKAALDYLVEPERGERHVRIGWNPTGSTRIISGEFWHPEVDQLKRTARYVRRLRLHQIATCLRELHRRRSAGRGINGGTRVTLGAAATATNPGTPASVLERRFTAPDAGPRPTSGVRPTPAERSLLERCGLGPVVDAVDKGDSYVYGAPADWHGAIALRLLRRDVGVRVRLDSIAAFVAENTRCEKGQAAAAIAGQVSRLAELGWISREGSHVRVLRQLPGGDPPEVPPESTAHSPTVTSEQCQASWGSSRTGRCASRAV